MPQSVKEQLADARQEVEAAIRHFHDTDYNSVEELEQQEEELISNFRAYMGRVEALL